MSHPNVQNKSNEIKTRNFSNKLFPHISLDWFLYNKILNFKAEHVNDRFKIFIFMRFCSVLFLLLLFFSFSSDRLSFVIIQIVICRY